MSRRGDHATSTTVRDCRKKATVFRTGEDALQRAVVDVLRVALPADAMVFAVPNGGWRNKTEAARLKGLGVVPGVADLVVLWGGGAILIELKTKSGRQSPAQRAWATKAEACGCSYHLCRSVDDVVAALRGHGMHLRVRIAEGAQ